MFDLPNWLPWRSDPKPVFETANRFQPNVIITAAQTIHRFNERRFMEVTLDFLRQPTSRSAALAVMAWASRGYADTQGLLDYEDLRVAVKEVWQKYDNLHLGGRHTENKVLRDCCALASDIVVGDKAYERVMLAVRSYHEYHCDQHRNGGNK